MDLLTRVELWMDIALAVGCVTYRRTLLARRGQPLLHRRLAFLLLALGFGYACRAVSMTGLFPFALRLQAFGFGWVPLAATLFVEAAMLRSSHFWMKLLLLGGTAFFCGTFWTDWNNQNWWLAGFLAYLSTTLVYLGVRLSVAMWREKPGPRRSLYGTLLVCAVLALLLSATDFRIVHQHRFPRLGALGVFLVVYFLSSALNAQGTRSFRSIIGRLLAAIATIAGLVIGLDRLLGGVEADVAIAVSALCVMGFLTYQPLRLAWEARRRKQRNDLLQRLASLPTSSLDAYLATLRHWPEITVARVLPAAELREQGFDDVQRYFEHHVVLADRPTVRFFTVSCLDPRLASSAEQVLLVLSAYDLEFVYPLDKAGTLLGIAPDPSFDLNTYRHVVEQVAVVARVLYERDCARRAREVA